MAWDHSRLLLAGDCVLVCNHRGDWNDVTTGELWWGVDGTSCQSQLQVSNTTVWHIVRACSEQRMGQSQTFHPWHLFAHWSLEFSQLSQEISMSFNKKLSLSRSSQTTTFQKLQIKSSRCCRGGEGWFWNVVIAVWVSPEMSHCMHSFSSALSLHLWSNLTNTSYDRIVCNLLTPPNSFPRGLSQHSPEFNKWGTPNKLSKGLRVRHFVIN